MTEHCIHTSLSLVLPLLLFAGASQSIESSFHGLQEKLNRGKYQNNLIAW